MLRATYVCEKCKKEETITTRRYVSNMPDGWQSARLEIDYNHKTEIFLCPDCQIKLGLLDECNRVKPIETIADRLVNCIAEIAAESINQE